MAEGKRAAALSAAVGLITASRYEMDMPADYREDGLTDADLFQAVTKVAGWLVRHGPDGDRLLAEIGAYAGWIGSGADLPPERDDEAS